MRTLPESARVFLLSIATTFVTNSVGFCSFQLFQQQIYKKREVTPKNEAGGKEKYFFVCFVVVIVFFNLAPTCFLEAHIEKKSLLPLKMRPLKGGFQRQECNSFGACACFVHILTAVTST